MLPSARRWIVEPSPAIMVDRRNCKHQIRKIWEGDALSPRKDRRKGLTIGAPGALIFHDAGGFIGDAWAEHGSKEMERGVDAERHPAAGHDASRPFHQHRLAHVDPWIARAHHFE